MFNSVKGAILKALNETGYKYTSIPTVLSPFITDKEINKLQPPWISNENNSISKQCNAHQKAQQGASINSVGQQGSTNSHSTKQSAGPPGLQHGTPLSFPGLKTNAAGMLMRNITSSFDIIFNMK